MATTSAATSIVRQLLLTAAVALLAATPAFAEAPPRVRGVVIGVNHDSITVKERDGSFVTLKTGADTAYRLRRPPQASTRSRSTTSLAPPSKGR